MSANPFGREEVPTSSLCYRVTRVCNLDCPFCQAPTTSDDLLYEADMFDSSGRAKELTLEEHFMILDSLEETHIESIKFTGGEPFVYPGFSEILERANDLGFDIVTCSNGTLLDEDSLECLSENQSRVKISLHGVNGEHDQILKSAPEDVIKESIRRLGSAGIYTSIHTIITEYNKEHLDDLFAFALENGVRKVTLIPMIPRGKGVNTMEYAVPDEECRTIHQRMKQKYGDQLKVSYLDLYEKTYFSLESDGVIYGEKENERLDDTIVDMREYAWDTNSDESLSGPETAVDCSRDQPHPSEVSSHQTK